MTLIYRHEKMNSRERGTAPRPPLYIETPVLSFPVDIFSDSSSGRTVLFSYEELLALISFLSSFFFTFSIRFFSSRVWYMTAFERAQTCIEYRTILSIARLRSMTVTDSADPGKCTTFIEIEMHVYFLSFSFLENVIFGNIRLLQLHLLNLKCYVWSC